MTGDSNDIKSRILRVLPQRWFQYVAPIRDALVGGLSDVAAWSYQWIVYARAQSRISTAYGIWLDIIAFDYLGRYLMRRGSSDSVFRAKILATILQERVTRAGMINAVTVLTGNVPWVFEPWNTFDTSGYGVPQMGYGVGRGGYGNMSLPAQTFMKVTRGAGSGVPSVQGYGVGQGGYGVGVIEYVGPEIPLVGVTDDDIYQMITLTKPTGAICWVAIGAPPIGSVGNGMAKRPAIFNSKNDSMNLAVT